MSFEGALEEKVWEPLDLIIKSKEKCDRKKDSKKYNSRLYQFFFKFGSFFLRLSDEA